MAQSQTAPRTADTEGPTSFNLMKWIAENPDKLKPPLGANTVFRQEDFMVTVVGGPNARTDYHVNPTEEFFFQIKGDVAIRIQHNGKPARCAFAGRFNLPAAGQCTARADARAQYGRAYRRAHSQERYDRYPSLVL
jgi:3-hydroxyanthranilate 3,4-dioxygenase